MRGDGYTFPRGKKWALSIGLPGPDGKSHEHREGGFKTEDDAKKKLKLLRDQKGAQKLGLLPLMAPRQERILVNELLDDLVTEYKKGGKKGIPREPDAPMLSHLKRLRKYFGGMRAVMVTPEQQGEQFIEFLQELGKANGTVNRATQILDEAWTIAARKNPPKVLRPLKIRKLDESDNVRKGKFIERQAEAVASSLPAYMGDAARFAYEVGSRSGEILKLRWDYLEAEWLRVPGKFTKNRRERIIALTPKLEEILARRRAARVEGCALIFHHNRKPIIDYRKCWHTACVVNGLGQFFCRDCQDKEGKYTSVLDANQRCPACGRKWKRGEAKYIGKLFHDFRRSAAYEMKKSGATTEDCMEVTGHKTRSMFERYADLFSEEELRDTQREVQQRRREWRQAEGQQTAAVVAQPPSISQRVQ